MATADERQIESLLHGEIAAAETYHQALEKVEDGSAAALRAIQSDHGEAIKFLYEQLSARSDEPANTSGAWGVVARAIEGAATLLGDKAALAALREGERSGLASYEMALTSGKLPADCQAHVESTLIPAQRRHIEVLNALIATA